ncbi:hypothetical protein LHYA1_G001747 [Lachnellula hyalina]|uniref:Alternative oxidase n=1 Tax=Lachnellula hyalina TaxID=1316788 RepID=A0A8H8R775_9HELO|nr:uncharacterized protein LHYA1_G001747 [Lachnellula hyalina]TVY29868.1 hypothetical protein LHYA1_G001747 [Lachnellula hyalina]
MPMPQQNLLTGINRRYRTLIPLTLVSIWAWFLWRPVFDFQTKLPWDKSSNSNQTQSTPISWEGTKDIFDFPPIESEAIKSICDDVEWNSTLVFTCDNSYGGVGNIRNSVLNCVRYAISAGASLVIPKIILRNSQNIMDLETGERTTLDYMFNVEHFVESLRLSCPALKLYSAEGDIPNLEKSSDPISVVPESLVEGKSRDGSAALQNSDQWRQQFYQWLEQYATNNAEGPIIVHVGRLFLKYSVYSDGERFALEFGEIMKVRSDARELATTTLHALIQEYSLRVNLTENILKDAFLGVHLRTERDAMNAWGNPFWPFSTYKAIVGKYMEQIQDPSRPKTAVIYVASGDLNEVGKFAGDVKALNMTVTSKNNLLTGKDKEDLEKLAWDQQALVDFLVMPMASDFAGLGISSFSWNIALRRHLFAKQKNFLHIDGPRMFEDEFSILYGGGRDKYPEYEACLWP